MDFLKTLLTQNSGSHITSNALLLCESAHNHQVFKKEKKGTLATYIKNINVNLSGGENRREALAHLLVLLPQCSKETLVIDGERWIRLCTQNMKSSDRAIIPSLIAVITFVLKHCHDNRDLFSKVSKLNASFLPQIYSLDFEFSECACNCLFEFVRLFPLQALPHRSHIEGMLMPFLTLPLSASADKTVSRAAKVFAILPVPGGGNIGQAKRGQLDQLIALGHSAIDMLFSGVREDEVYQFSRDHKLPIRALESACELNEPIRRLLTSARLVGNCFTFLQVFLETSSVEVRPKELIRLAFRVLQVELKTLRSVSGLESVALAFLLPNMHSRALQLLKALVTNEISEVFLNLVEEQVVATLKSTNQTLSLNKKEEEEEPHHEKDKFVRTNFLIRNLCYQTLIQIIKVSRGCHKASVEGLVPTLVRDIVPTKESLSLKSATRGGRLSLLSAKKKSKKKGYKVTSEDDTTGGTQEVASPESANQCVPTTVAALELIEALFLHAHHVLTLAVVRTLNKHLVDLLHSRRYGVCANTTVRSSMFSAIIAYAMYPHPLCPPSYAMIYQALEEGARDPNPSVSEVCGKGVAALTFVTANPSTMNWADASRRIIVADVEGKENELLTENEEILVNGKYCENEIDEKSSTVESDDENESNGSVHQQNALENEEMLNEKEYGNEEDEKVQNGEEKMDKNAISENEEINENEESFLTENESFSLENEESDSSYNKNEETRKMEKKRKIVFSNKEKKGKKKRLQVKMVEKPKTEDKKGDAASLSLADMLSSFVDADPDSD